MVAPPYLTGRQAIWQKSPGCCPFFRLREQPLPRATSVSPSKAADKRRSRWSGSKPTTGSSTVWWLGASCAER